MNTVQVKKLMSNLHLCRSKFRTRYMSCNVFRFVIDVCMYVCMYVCVCVCVCVCVRARVRVCV